MNALSATFSAGWRLGRFELRPAERVLLVDGEPAPLGARAFDVLQALVERRDRVVSKNELLDLAWPGLVVEENNLTVQISALRKVLGPNAITTVTGRGYRCTLGDSTPPFEAVSGHAPRAVAELARRMAAIVYAEVAGWAEWLARDPAQAIGTWQGLREFIEAGLAAPGLGARPIELAAEGSWIDFASAVDALRWALELQQRLAERRAAERGFVLALRIGIDVGDFVVDDGKLMGEAARWPRHLPAAASAQGEALVVSEAVRGLVLHRLPVLLAELPQRLPHPHAHQPVVVYSAAPRPEGASSLGGHPALTWQDMPAIAVLPFSSPLADAAYFGEGITEEIVTALSANRGLLVIARSSTLRYRGSEHTPAQIAAELGVRYLLTGSVQRQDERLRIGAELVDAAANRVIWAERFDGEVSDLFGFQAQIAASIAAAIDPRVREAEIIRVAQAARGPTGSLTAYDCVLRALAVQYTLRDEDLAFAGAMYRRAIELDPHYAQAHAQLAWWHNLRVGEGRSPEVNEDARAAERLSLRAIELDPRDAWALAVAGHVQAFVKKRLDVGMDMFEQALALNPSCAFAWARSATTLAFMGNGEEATRRVRHAMRLSPFDQQTFTFFTTHGTAAFVSGQYAEAAVWYAKARRLNPGYRAAWRMGAAALALAGERDESRAVGEELMRVEPGFRVDAFAAWYPMREPALACVVDGMRRAGLPG